MEKQLTQEEFMNEYKDVELSLESYYKYSFSYSGKKDGKIIYVSVGGSSDDIYRFVPKIKGTTPVHKLDSEIGINHASVYENEIKVEYYNGNSW